MREIRDEMMNTDLKGVNQTAVFIPAGNCMFKANNMNTRTRCEFCSKLTIKTPDVADWAATETNLF